MPLDKDQKKSIVARIALIAADLEAKGLIDHSESLICIIEEFKQEVA